MPYSKLYILTELSANDVKFISVDRQKLDLSKYIYIIMVTKFYICRDTARFYEYKNDLRICLSDPWKRHFSNVFFCLSAS